MPFGEKSAVWLCAFSAWHVLPLSLCPYVLPNPRGRGGKFEEEKEREEEDDEDDEDEDEEKKRNKREEQGQPRGDKGCGMSGASSMMISPVSDTVLRDAGEGAGVAARTSESWGSSSPSSCP